MDFMEFLKQVLGDDLFKQVETKLNEHNKNYKYVLYPGKVLEYAGMKGGENDEA